MYIGIVPTPPADPGPGNDSLLLMYMFSLLPTFCF